MMLLNVETLLLLYIIFELLLHLQQAEGKTVGHTAPYRASQVKFWWPKSSGEPAINIKVKESGV